MRSNGRTDSQGDAISATIGIPDGLVPLALGALLAAGSAALARDALAVGVILVATAAASAAALDGRQALPTGPTR